MSCWEHMMECCNGRGRFLLEAILWWIFISLPINFVSILFAVQAPTYVHSDEDTYHYGYGYNSIYEANISTSSQGNSIMYLTVLKICDKVYDDDFGNGICIS